MSLALLAISLFSGSIPVEWLIAGGGERGGTASFGTTGQGGGGGGGGVKQGTAVLGVGTSFRVGVGDFIPFLEAVLRDDGMFIRNGSGALMIAYVAAGRLIGYFEPHMNAWDALAGFVLVREAGGQCNAFMENGGLLRGNPVIVANPAIWRRLASHAQCLPLKMPEEAVAAK